MFNFPEADRNQITEYKKNFLKTVIFQFRFESNDAIIKNKEKILEIVKNDFPRRTDSVSTGFSITFDKQSSTPIVQPGELKDHMFEVRSSDGKKTMRFSSSEITVTIGGEAYTNFNEQISLFTVLNSIFSTVHIGTLTRVAIRKVNILEYGVSEKFPPATVGSIFFARDLMNNFNYFPSPECMEQNIKTIKYEHESYGLFLRYGTIVPNKKNRSVGHAVIDIDLFEQDQINIVNFKENLEVINKEIFNIFIWALNPEVLTHLKG
jgi:uncharacterized protein (TIGR04255 family)